MSNSISKNSEKQKFVIGYFGECYMLLGKNTSQKGLEDWVTIMAKDSEHAKKYYEVCFALWRKIDQNPIDGGHDTNHITWVGTSEKGYAVLPDNYYCNCHECENSGKMKMTIPEIVN